jgi:hypothetical protein
MHPSSSVFNILLHITAYILCCLLICRDFQMSKQSFPTRKTPIPHSAARSAVCARTGAYTTARTVSGTGRLPSASRFIILFVVTMWYIWCVVTGRRQVDALEDHDHGGAGSRQGNAMRENCARGEHLHWSFQSLRERRCQALMVMRRS